MAGAALVTAQFVSGKATRDALLLTSLDLTSLPAILVATSICSILLVALNGRGARRFAPGTLVPASFVLSGLLFCIEWALRQHTPSFIATVVYLHVSSAGPLLASGFWLIASERFDPRTAKRQFVPIAAAGTLGGLLSALAAERVATLLGAPAMLPLLAFLQFASASMIRGLAAGCVRPTAADSSDVTDRTAQPRSSIRIVAAAPYLRNLALLVLLGTTGAALVDYLFKAQAVETFGRGDHLLRFFALYYGAVSLITFVIQSTLGRVALEKWGLAFAASTPSAALLAGSIGSLIGPGFPGIAFARGSEAVWRGSLFRAGYELFYTPIPAAEKRSAKSLIDVVFDRLGDAVGGGLVRLAILAVPAALASAILSMAVVCCAGAMIAASRLTKGYIGSLETSLVGLSRRAGGVDVTDRGTRIGVLETLRAAAGSVRSTGRRAEQGAVAWASLDADVQDILALRSRDRARVAEVLLRQHGLSAALVPHAIGLLAWDPVAEHAMFALRKVAEERVGELVDALLDPNQDFSVRRRLARVFSVCVSQRAASGLLFGLDDPRFDVRYQSARSLAAILEKNPRVQIDSDRIFDVVLREVTVGRPVWESRRLLDVSETTDSRSPVDEFVRQRAGDSLAHVFTLLSLVLPREPLQIAFRSLYADDRYLQGTALEYLESVLPGQIRQRLWPFLERGASMRSSHPDRAARPHEEVIAELLRSNHSLMLNLEELRRESASFEVRLTV
jgi:hypothetical protein